MIGLKMTINVFSPDVAMRGDFLSSIKNVYDEKIISPFQWIGIRVAFDVITK